MQDTTIAERSTSHPQITLTHLRRVEAVVNRLLSPRFDREQLALDILTESWLNDEPNPSLAFIRHRCWDVLRRERKEHQMLDQLAHLSHGESEPELNGELKDSVARLVRVLDPLEKKAIALRYTLDLSVADAATQCSLSEGAFRLLVQRALWKMKEAARHRCHRRIQW